MAQRTFQNDRAPFFAGADVGASRTKVVVIDTDGHIAGYGVARSGTDFRATADGCLTDALAMAEIGKERITRTVSTGYGRKNVSYAQDQRTEISCHGKGCFHYFPFAITIIDIGGQDNKIIKLDDSGRRTSFKMNRKCAAGTGAFLEEMSPRLDIPLSEMNGLAAASTDMVRLGSFCTVFSATEVLENIRRGKQVEDIVKGLFFSVISRITEMDAFTDNVVMTGGVVAHNPYLVEMTRELIDRPILVPELPQFTGALGAALYAKETYED
ncbi:2-hydroxyglutaryl-CoA dehydratase [Desulfosarcina alkanivorans]|uniref:2-hydroxyglutaryl-CoA dehydratase n=1 Tax=Desulfosarcina alkanivorans TaxID=571177 RepID=A0A5K7YRZ8_9BACT|nr:acyl-CoA dehydratase activase [Desulfosarcina alkanivorans]BBO67417.1 2-hydroxyglutaryl-CoA dehydratase [Desulfosarcina alkanivorans]